MEKTYSELLAELAAAKKERDDLREELDQAIQDLAEIKSCISCAKDYDERDACIKTKKIEHIHCPANAWDCPYYTDENHPCRCTLPHPEEDCDDFGYFWNNCFYDDWIDDDWEVEA